MFIPVLMVASVVVALLRGGRIQALAQITVKQMWLLFVPLLLQLVAFSPLGEFGVLGYPLAQLLYALSLGVAALALWLNRQLPGIGWIALGLFLNFVVIFLNGGFMPLANEARVFAGLPPVTGRDMNVVPMTDATILPWLGDVLPLPAFVPFANVFSVGDLLIAFGGIVFTQRTLVRSKGRSTVGALPTDSAMGEHRENG
jgi:hypothetical protein